MMKFARAALVAAVACSVAGCAGFSSWLQGVDAAVRKYAPIVGKDIVAFGDILYQVECSPAMPVGSAVAANILNIVAPNTTAANKFATRVQQNDDIAAQLCPLVSRIATKVGSVPQNVQPSQVIAPMSAQLPVKAPRS